MPVYGTARSRPVFRIRSRKLECAIVRKTSLHAYSLRVAFVDIMQRILYNVLSAVQQAPLSCCVLRSMRQTNLLDFTAMLVTFPKQAIPTHRGGALAKFP